MLKIRRRHVIAFSGLASSCLAGCVDWSGGPMSGGVGAPPPATETIIIGSLADDGTIKPEGAVRPALSADGRFLVFETLATLSADDRVPDIKPGLYDVYRRDLTATGLGSNLLVSQMVTINQSNGDDREPSINGDGSLIAWSSTATNYGVAASRRNIYRNDVIGETIQRNSQDDSGIEANGISTQPRINSTGRYVAFTSLATNLVPLGAPDTNAQSDVFRFDNNSRTCILVSVSAANAIGNGASSSPSVDDSGNLVAFVSTSDNLLLGADTNVMADIFLKNFSNGGEVVRCSVRSSGVEANGPSSSPSISAQGNFVVFVSSASNLVANDTNGSDDIFIFNRSNSTTTRVSLTDGGLEANGPSASPTVSDDGRYVCFSSTASNLVTGDTNGVSDIFMRDRVSNKTIRVNTLVDGSEFASGSFNPFMSADHSTVAFETVEAVDPADTNGVTDIYVQAIAPTAFN